MRAMLRATPLLLLASCAQCATVLQAPRVPGLALRQTLRGGYSLVNPSNTKETFLLGDSRRICVFEDDKAISAAVVETVESVGKAAIEKKGAFSICVPGGSIVKALSALSKDALDFSKVHVFFCNERIGEYKCYKGAMESFIERCGIPESQVHKVPEGDAVEVAKAYEQLVNSQPESVISKNSAGMPCMDLTLIGSGEDGHCASIHPNSAEVKATGLSKVYLPISADSKQAITVSIDMINSSKHVIISAAGPKRKDMVATALRVDAHDWSCPCSFIKAVDTTWLVDKESIAGFQK
uniref:Glucosamine/galactosamine-6-phosphate isomerase domain-containing protein n=1 Tax=Guillardia theta TaxID=55529 RepID=A0A7S4PJV4_GUITH